MYIRPCLHQPISILISTSGKKGVLKPFLTDVGIRVSKCEQVVRFPRVCTRTWECVYSLSPVFAAVRALNVQEEHSILAGLLIGFIMVIYEKILFSSLALNRKFILNMLSRKKLF